MPPLEIERVPLAFNDASLMGKRSGELNRTRAKHSRMIDSIVVGARVGGQMNWSTSGKVQNDLFAIKKTAQSSYVRKNTPEKSFTC